MLTSHRQLKTPIDQLNEYIGNLLAEKRREKTGVDFLQHFKKVEAVDFSYAGETAKRDDSGILKLENTLNSDKMNTEVSQNEV